MKLVKYLLPSYFRKTGWIAIFPLLVLFWYMDGMGGLAQVVDQVTGPMSDSDFYLTHSLRAAFRVWGNTWMDEFLILAITLCFIFIAFSREKTEDEYVWKIRMESLVWAFIVDALLIFAATFLLFGEDYVMFMFLNFYLILMLFIAKFRIALFRAKKSLGHEE